MSEIISVRPAGSATWRDSIRDIDALIDQHQREIEVLRQALGRALGHHRDALARERAR